MIGILIGLYLEISVVFLFVLFCILSIIIYMCKMKKIYIFFIIALICGFIQINFLETQFETKYFNVEDVKIKAIVISDLREKEYKYSCTIKVQEINGNKEYKDTKLILNLKKSIVENEIPSFGDEIEIIGIFEKANSASNYKGFDYEQYLRSKGIFGLVEADKYKIISTNKINILDKFLNHIQNDVERKFERILGKEESALCVGILIGNRENISEQVEDNFKKSNLTHMLAVSGSHITYIITAFSVMLGKTNKKFAKLFTILFLVFFMALTGFTASVVRASIMGIIVLIGGIIYRKSDTINNLGLSSLLILVCNPYTVVDAGFWLSYAGTIGIILLNDRINSSMLFLFNRITKGKMQFDNKTKTLNKKSIKYVGITIIKGLISSFSITISANILIIAVMAYMFSTISITFWISNILAAPIMEITTLFGFLIYFVSIIFFPCAQFLGEFLNILLILLIKIAEVTAKIPGSSIYIKTPYIIECIIYYALVFLVFNWQILKNSKIYITILKYKYIIISIILIVILSSVTIFSLISNKIKINFIDVGQGDCTLIETIQKKHILIDGGGSEFGDYDVGEKILLPYLLDRRITKIDYLLISHFDSDHIGGLFYVMDNIKVENVIISKQGEQSSNFIKFADIVEKNKINVIVVQKGDYIKIDKYSYLEILFPEQELIKDNILNNNSIVAKFNFFDFTMLFTGDIEKIAEDRLVDLYENTNKLNAIILKIAHHGSKTSSTESFLNMVKPKIALIGVGKDNKFGHPNDEVLKVIKKYTKLIYRTDQCGEVSIVINNKGKIIKLERFKQ